MNQDSYMGRTLVIVAAVAMIAAFSPLASTQASSAPASAMEAADTVVFDQPTDHPGDEGEAVCTSEDASTVTSIDASAPGLRDNAYCTTGSHDPGFYSITHGAHLDVMEDSEFTGVVESIIQYDGGERRWACSFDAGTWTGCEGAGSWPGEAVEFCHDVWAYETAGETSEPLVSGFQADCPFGDLGLGISSNTQPAGDGIPSEAWSAYVVHG